MSGVNQKPAAIKAPTIARPMTMRFHDSLRLVVGPRLPTAAADGVLPLPFGERVCSDGAFWPGGAEPSGRFDLAENSRGVSLMDHLSLPHKLYRSDAATPFEI